MHIPAYTYLCVRLLLQSECTLHSVFGGATVFVVPKLVTHILTQTNGRIMPKAFETSLQSLIMTGKSNVESVELPLYM